jgi:hypothetical protein
MAGLDTPEAITAVQDPLRRDQLNTRVQYYAAMGWHVESGSDFRAVVARGTEKLPNTVNVILTLATGGLWLIYWIFSKGKRRVLLTVSEDGVVDEQSIVERQPLSTSPTRVIAHAIGVVTVVIFIFAVLNGAPHFAGEVAGFGILAYLGLRLLRFVLDPLIVWLLTRDLSAVE